MDYTIETLIPAYFDADALRLPAYHLRRYQQGNTRIYHTYDLDGSLQKFPGVTAVCEKVLPTSPYLTRWELMKGEDAEKYKNERAAYGTFMHKLFAEFVINKTMNLSDIPARVLDEAAKKNLSITTPFGQWGQDLAQDVLSFHQFCVDYAVKPLMIECPLCSQVYKVASQVDLLCEITWKQARRLAIVDFKSNRSGNGYESHELQLAYYDAMVRENFPEFGDQEILLFIWSPKDWSKAPAYHFKNHTGTSKLTLLKEYTTIFYTEFWEALSNVSYFSASGELSLTGENGNNYQRLALDDLLAQEYAQKQEA
jgi:hypothetical protein